MHLEVFVFSLFSEWEKIPLCFNLDLFSYLTDFYRDPQVVWPLHGYMNIFFHSLSVVCVDGF